MRPRAVINENDGRVRREQVVRWSGCGKVAYSSRKLAKDRAKRSSHVTGELIHAYHCHPCHAWHIGHPIGSRSPQRLDYDV